MKYNKTLIIRIDEKRLNNAKLMAMHYFKGDLSKWIRYCLDFHELRVRIKRPPPKKTKLE